MVKCKDKGQIFLFAAHRIGRRTNAAKELKMLADSGEPFALLGVGAQGMWEVYSLDMGGFSPHDLPYFLR